MSQEHSDRTRETMPPPGPSSPLIRPTMSEFTFWCFVAFLVVMAALAIGGMLGWFSQ